MMTEKTQVAKAIEELTYFTKKFPEVAFRFSQGIRRKQFLT